MKKLLITCGVLALTAGAANAATILEFDAIGTYNPIDPIPGVTTVGIVSIGSEVNGHSYFDLSTERDYSVSYDLTIDSQNPETTWTFSGTEYLGSFALTDLALFLLSLPVILDFEVNDFTAGPGTAFSTNLDFVFGQEVYDFVSAYSDHGTYSLAATFTAAVPLPASLPLALSAFGLMGYVGSRKKKDLAAAA